jgi:hypothetical protein
MNENERFASAFSGAKSDEKAVVGRWHHGIFRRF